MLIQVLSKRFDLLEPYINQDNYHVVLLQDGVYLLPQLMQSNAALSISVLEHDWLASGLAHQSSFNQHLKAERVNIISKETWVALCAEHTSVMTLQA